MSTISFDTISLVPKQVSDIEHRSDVDTSVKLGPITLNTPFISSPMPDVTNARMAKTLYGFGALGIIHRFQPIMSEAEEYLDVSTSCDAGVSIGVGEDYQERADALYAMGARIFLIDVANGANLRVGNVVGWMRKSFDDIFLMAGNVANGKTFRWLQDQGVDAIRVGIAGGSVCATGQATGIHVPTLESVRDCCWDTTNRYAMIIADGGIRTPGDACKALALGADLVMCGSIFAGTEEAPGPVIMHKGEKFKAYRGASSYGIQYAWTEEEPDYVEGIETMVKYKSSVTKVLREFTNGLRSSMSYFNAHNLAEYRSRTDYIEL